MAKYNMKAAFPIEAMQWKASFGVWDLTDWFLRAVTNGSIRRDHRAADQLLVDTLHAGTKVVSPGHWITMGLKGEFDTYTPEVFASMYEAVTDAADPVAEEMRVARAIADAGNGGRIIEDLSQVYMGGSDYPINCVKLAKAAIGATDRAKPTDAQIKHMVDRFLGWRLPENFNPDCGISFKKTYNENTPSGPQKHEPTGTNLFDAEQATVMVRYMLEAPSSGVQIEVIEADRPEDDEIVLSHENFQQCDTCAAKPGSPTLCRGCIHNRVLIERLNRATKLTDEEAVLVIHALILGKDCLLYRVGSDNMRAGWRKIAHEMRQLHDRLVARTWAKDVHDHD